MKWTAVKAMSETLKPCPFCGGKPNFYQIYSGGVNSKKVWKVMCGGEDGKKVDCIAILNEWDTQEQAAEAWNSRYTYD